MGAVRDFVAALVKSGPENIQAAIKAIEKLPSEGTINRGIDTLDRLYPYMGSIMQLASLMSPQNMETLRCLSQNLPDKDTIDRLARLIPYLDKLPDKQTLKDLLSKADSLEVLLKSLNNT